MSDRFSTKGGRSYPVRHGTPPPFEFFSPARPPAGSHRFGMSLGDVRIEMDGLDAELASALLSRYEAYADPIAEHVAGALQLRFSREPCAYFIEPPESPQFNPIWIACEGPRVRYLGHQVAGWFDTTELRGDILLSQGHYEPELRALENFIRCLVAWSAAARGGALVHAASAERNGKAYLFYGESGAGKSTLSAAGTRGRVISDDLSLVLRRPGGGLDLIGSPFRGTYEDGPPVIGRFPLAAGFRIVKADRAEVRPAPRIVAFGQLVGNLTFVAEAFGERPDIFASIEEAFAGTPLFHLHFRKDDSYWDAIDAAGL